MNKRKTKPEKYSTEQVSLFLQTYLQQKENLEPISATGVAKWCNEVLHLEPPLSYTDLTRKPEIKGKIQKYNDRVLYSITNTSGDDVSLSPGYLIDIETVIRTSASTKGIRIILQKANDTIEELTESNRKLVRNLQKEQQALQTMQLENESLLNTTDQLRALISAQKKKAAETSKEMARLKRIIKKQQEYIESHVYDPISATHFMEMGLEPDSSPEPMPESYDSLVMQDEDIGSAILGIHNKPDVHGSGIVSNKMADLMEQLSSL